MTLKKTFVGFLGLALLLGSLVSCSKGPARDARLGSSLREDVNGWIYVHLKGSPREIGFQHGWQLASEIDDVLKTMAFYIEKSTGRNWAFFRNAVQSMFWPKLDQEYRDEIEGIVEGLKARLSGNTYDQYDILALNGWIELAQYYVPFFDEKTKPGAGDKKAPPSCSAFIATGSYTQDGKIVIGHNNWVEYMIGERWNAVLDIEPVKGYRIMMDAMPGYIHSGDDFAINGAGIVYTETTISQFKGFDESKAPEFLRARKASQYAASIDDFIRIMTTDNNGGYANDWLVGDLKTNEIARFELGLKNHRVWRSSDGYFIGSNFASDPKLIAEETTFKPNDQTQSVLVRKKRWEQLMDLNKGKIDAELGKAFEADHVDAATGAAEANGNVLCGHVDTDPNGLPEFSWKPFLPGGSVQGKVTTAALAKDMKFWGRMGHPCGEAFIAADFLAKHPEFKWQEIYLKDMPGHPWTLFEGKK
jgi:hypothetical protein